MRIFLLLLTLMSAGCATAPTRYALESAPQTCVEFCHDYALGLVDLGSAGQAGPVFDLAEKHFQDTSRTDIPKKDWERAAMRVELALGRAATARVNGGDIHPPMIAAVKAFSELLEMQAPQVWNWIALDFLRDADILRFDREWDAIKVDPGARFVLRQFLLVQRGAAPDLLLIKARADKVKGLNQLAALSYILAKSGDSRTVIAQGVNERLFVELKIADVGVQQVVLAMQLTSNFVYWATPDHQETVRWIMQKATELEVRGYFMPVTSFVEVSERCEVMKPYYKTLLATVRNDLRALDLLMGCIVRWGSVWEIMERMSQWGPKDSGTIDWQTFLFGDFFAGTTSANDELMIEENRSIQLFIGQRPTFDTPPQNGLPYDDLFNLRQARTIAEFDSEFSRFSEFPWWHFMVGHYLVATAEDEGNEFISDNPWATTFWEALTQGALKKTYCNEVLKTAFFEARRGGVRAAFPLLKLPRSCARAESEIREVFLVAEHHLELAPNHELLECSAEKLKLAKPNSNEAVWCEVVLHRVKHRVPVLEMADTRNERDTAVHVLLALGKIDEARALFDSYGISNRNDFMVDQLLRGYEGKPLDIPGIRFTAIWFVTFPHQVIVPALWGLGRHDDACEVLTALTTVRPWIAHPGKVDCPATNAAYKERWGFDPPWTLPQDEILAYLREPAETK